MPIDPNDADVTDIIGASGDCPTVTVGDGPAAKTWTISWPTQDAKTRLNNLLIGVAEENVNKSNKGLSPARRERADADFSAALRHGDYKTWGPGWLAEYNTPRGQLMFLLSLLRETHPRATEADAASLFRDAGGAVTRALLRVAPPFFSLLIDDMPTAPMANSVDLAVYKKAMIKEMMTSITLVLDAMPLTPSIPTGAK